MTRDAELRCRCGEVRGRVKGASPENANHMVCYCEDCQAYLHHLGRADLLDAHGGTDIVQVAPASLLFDAGADRIVGLRLTPKGLYRWYATCCKTPLGNTFSPGLPFVGIVARAFDDAGNPADAVFGKPVARAYSHRAVGKLPEGTPGMTLRPLLHAVGLILGWWLRGQGWPHPYYDRSTRQPRPPLTVLSRAERDALRSLCGPQAAASQ